MNIKEITKKKFKLFDSNYRFFLRKKLKNILESNLKLINSDYKSIEDSNVQKTLKSNIAKTIRLIASQIVFIAL